MKIANKYKKIHIGLCFLFVVFISILYIANDLVIAESATVYFKGYARYKDANTTETSCGKFTINDKTAYCMEHNKNSPGAENGYMSMTSFEINDSNKKNRILKCLYYAYNGPNPWSYFNSKSEDFGVCCTSKVLSYIYNGTAIGNKQEFINFYNYINSASTPEPITDSNYLIYIKDKPSGNNINTPQLSVSNNRQSTNKLYFDAYYNNYISLPEINKESGIQIIVEHLDRKSGKYNNKTYTSGRPVLYGGDYFIVSAPLGYSGSYGNDSYIYGQKGIKATFYKPLNSNYQSMAVIGEVQDKLKFNIKFNGMGVSVIARKVADIRDKSLEGAEFALYYSPNKSNALFEFSDVSKIGTGEDVCFSRTLNKYSGADFIASGTTDEFGYVNWNKITNKETSYTIDGSQINIENNILGRKNSINQLKEGYYYLIELKSPIGYIINENVSVEKIASSTMAFTFAIEDKIYNTKGLTLFKDIIDKDVTGFSSYSVKGAEYQIYAWPQSYTLTGWPFDLGYGFGMLSAINIKGSNRYNKFHYENGQINVEAILNEYDDCRKPIYIATFIIDEEGVGHVKEVSNQLYNGAATDYIGMDVCKPIRDAMKNVDDKTLVLPENFKIPSTQLNGKQALWPAYFMAFETKLPEGEGCTWDDKYYGYGGLTYADYAYKPIVSNETVLYNPLNITILKESIINDEESPSLEGTVFEVSYYSGYYSSNDLPDNPERKWYIESKYNNVTEKYEARLDKEHLSGAYISDDLYVDLNDSSVQIPAGTIAIKEYLAAPGYVINSGTITDSLGNHYNDIFVGHIIKQNDILTLVSSINVTYKLDGASLTFTNDEIERKPVIKTQYNDSLTNNNLTFSNKESKIYDKVLLNNLKSNTSYHLVGQIMEIVSSEQVRPLLDNLGQPITSELEFTSQNMERYTKEEVLLPFTVDTSHLGGKSVVIYETLYLSSDLINPVAIHHDSTDINQIGYIPSIQTNASSKGNNCVYPGVSNIEDIISIKNIIPETTYKICGQLVYEDGSIVENSYKEILYEAGESDFELKMTFENINLSENHGKKVIAFEKVYDLNDNLIAEHADINSVEQSILILDDIYELPNVGGFGTGYIVGINILVCFIIVAITVNRKENNYEKNK